MDVTALYPKIYQELSAKIVKETYMESEFEIEEIDWKAMSLYMAFMVDRQKRVREGIAHLV